MLNKTFVALLLFAGLAHSQPLPPLNLGYRSYCMGLSTQPMVQLYMPVSIGGTTISLPFCALVGSRLTPRQHPSISGLYVLDADEQVAPTPAPVPAPGPAPTPLPGMTQRVESFDLTPLNIPDDQKTLTLTLQRTPAMGTVLMLFLRSMRQFGDAMDVDAVAQDTRQITVNLPSHRPLWGDAVKVVYWSAEP